MNTSNKFISALDISLLLIVMLLIGLFSIRYDADKGIGEQNYIPIFLTTEQKNIFDPSFSDLIAIRIEDSIIKISIIKNNIIINERRISDLNDFLSQIDRNSNIVLYHPKSSEPIFLSIVELLIDNNISFIIAKK